MQLTLFVVQWTSIFMKVRSSRPLSVFFMGLRGLTASWSDCSCFRGMYSAARAFSIQSACDSNKYAKSFFPFWTVSVSKKEGAACAGACAFEVVSSGESSCGRVAARVATYPLHPKTLPEL
jgi:hypothetical protein